MRPRKLIPSGKQVLKGKIKIIIVKMNTEVRYIYKCSWFETKRHKKSHTNMYFEKAEHTKWIFETRDWFLDLVRVEYIMVHISRPEYESAVNNSKKADEEAHHSLSLILT
jgi:hypothetical protein